ncbi:MAG: S1 RNA-binding domain-containing protein, partial [Acidobacteria bacterium]|nr:S1 RNA-binding domain-containing protein [Acidobacteriota bacterium]
EGAKIRLTERPVVSVVLASAAEKTDVPPVNAESAETAEGTTEETAAEPVAETAEITQAVIEEETAAEPIAETAEITQAVIEEETAAEPAAETAEITQAVIEEETAAEPVAETAEITQAVIEEEAAAEPIAETAEITQAVIEEETAAEPVAETAEITQAVIEEEAAVANVEENTSVNPLAAMLSSLTAPVIMAYAPAAAVVKAVVDPRIILKDLITRHKVRAVAIGAGTNARELENLLRQVLAEEGLADVFIAGVNDAGLAIYSSSRLAREEFPNYSASMRCAVSLARRLQDPLSEMVKLDPKLIGVGQYQHDVDQKELHRALAQTVQFCVNNVGVNLNAGGAPLLRYVSGLNDKLARRIVAVRSSQGAFVSRAAMNDALKLEPAVYEQAAAFLRITDGENALDRTAIHPESYPIVEKMAGVAGVSVGELIGNRELVQAIDLESYATETAGLPTLTDIREELLHPGRDPRRTFKLPKFNSNVRELSDLKPGMTLEGIVTNVTNFGAFVDVGVRQDGLVHLSQMSSRFIRDPREAVKVGDVVEVRVISVDSETKRIGLSMKIASSSGAQRKRPRRQRRDVKTPPRAQGSAGENGRPARPAKEAGKEGETSSGRRERPSRSGGRSSAPRRDGNRPPRRPERAAEQFFETSSAEQTPPPPVYDGPEPSFEEKIAILQSKFRGIK